ncbi:hypothetical protein CRD86_25855 [Escherichia coli]|nr:hypothetical protein CRD86_25855 [Escherichia coli]
MSEEAEDNLKRNFLLTHRCGISHQARCTFHTPPLMPIVNSVYTSLSLRDWFRACSPIPAITC